MKNGKKTISLVLTALTVVTLSSCSDVTANDKGIILDYNYNGQKLEITTSDIIEKYLNESRGDHAKALYDSLYEIVVRRSFESDGSKKGLLADYKNDVVTKAKEAIESEKDTADNNGQSWHDYLVNKGYDKANTTDSERENEFYLDTLFTEMKERVDKQFKEEFNDWKISEDEVKAEYNIIWGKKGYLNKYLPYHVRHILVKSDATSDNAYSRGHITADNATNLYNTINALVRGDTFSNVAKNFSDDEGSKNNGGEYIMDTKTSFVNEFQLGIYTYDTIIHPQYVPEDEADKAAYNEKVNSLHIPAPVEKQLKEFGPSFIPYGAVKAIYETRNKTTTEDGLKIYDGDEDYLPRNIYYNKYFQNRNVGFITDESIWTSDDYNADGTVNDGKAGYTSFEDSISGETVFTDIDENGHYQTTGKRDSYLEENWENFKNSFVEIEFDVADPSNPGKTIKVKKNVLCDTEKNPIIAVRNQESSGGVHFIIIERSAFDENDIHFNAAAYREQGAEGSDEEIAEQYKTSLNEYYATSNPKSADGINQTTGKPHYAKDGAFPSVEKTINGEKVWIPKQTYVQPNIITDSSKNHVDDTIENYSKRSEEINKQITTNMDAVNQFTKYFWLNTEDLKLNDFISSEDADKFSIKPQELVENYISTQQTNQERSDAKNIQDKWNEYMAAINKQNWERRYNLLPEILAARFGEEELYKDGKPGYNPDYYDGTNNNSK